MNILLFGGSGFIGAATARLLQQQGHRVAAPGSREFDFLQPDFARITGYLKNCNVVINAVGVMSRHRAVLETVHHHTPARLARLAAEHGVRRWVQLSALGADACHPVAFLGSKGRGDQAVAGSGLSTAVAQPSVVFGRGGASCELFIRLARLPLICLPEGGHYALQPVHLDDVAEGLANLATGTATGRIAFTGSQRCTLAGYLNLLRRNLHRKTPARILALPRPLAEWGAALAEASGNGMLSRDSLRLLREGSVADCTAFAALIGRPPQAAGTFGCRSKAVGGRTAPKG
ncbi:MAG: sugar nucleotide-binding protein [Eikenella sp.]|nr:sugar nucleotide-binding protein [Eikenella sp.]